MIALVLILLFAIGLLVAPVAVAARGGSLGALPTLIMTTSGIALAVFSGVLIVITRLYVKTKASEAFVRTGMGGIRVIKDGGALVIPVVHQIVRISLQTVRLEVHREGADALITKDKLRSDIRAEFFVRVPPTDESIKNAARSFGDSAVTDNGVRQLVEDKLISALRTVAATKTLEELNSERDTFLREVTENVKHDLEHNGLTLETATISKLDQTDPSTLRETNIFDAQGLRTIAEITQNALTKRNELLRSGEQARTEQDVATRQQILELERRRAEAEAGQAAEVAKTRALKDREAKEQQILAQRDLEVAERAKQQAIEVAEREKQKAVEVAEMAKAEAVKRAEQVVEVAEREKQRAVAVAEGERARAQAEQAKSEAEAEKQRQEVKTVQAVADADRERQRQVIAAQGEAERRYLEAQRAADAKAYAVQRDAESRKSAADADADAVTKKARAEADAAKLRAEGAKAEAMVPVEVRQAEVEVERKRVEVLAGELEARAASGDVAQQFEVAKLKIIKEAEIRIEAARATATLLGKVQAQVFGTPNDVAEMTKSFQRGLGLANWIDGFFASGSDSGSDVVQGVGTVVERLVQSATDRSGGAQPETPEEPKPGHGS